MNIMIKANSKTSRIFLDGEWIELSKHAILDHPDRLIGIMSTIDIGNTVISVNYDRYGDMTVQRRLTSTGVMILLSADGRKVVTLYMANWKKAEEIYKDRGYSRMPPSMGNIIKKNTKQYPHLLNV